MRSSDVARGRERRQSISRMPANRRSRCRPRLHVLVDKAFALDARRAGAVVDHAREVGRTLSVYENRRGDGDFLTVEALLAWASCGP